MTDPVCVCVCGSERESWREDGKRRSERRKAEAIQRFID